MQHNTDAAWHLDLLVGAIRTLSLDRVHDGTLKPFVSRRLRDGVSHKTVNLSLGYARRILNLAARQWRAS